ncbi:MAG TPA: universal stress protein [Longimicrobium sp.]|nr:universal stress protein [Longimicrobium sp.]
MFRTIAVPLDGSAAAECALPHAAALARASAGRLELLRVHQKHRPGEALEAIPAYAWEQVVAYDNGMDQEAFEREADELTARTARTTVRWGVHAVAHLLRGDPAPAIVEHVREAGVDLMVVATHASGGRMHGPLGSVAEAIVRESHVPVLLLRPGPSGPAPDEEPALRSILVPLDGSAFSETVIEPVVSLALATGAEVWLLRVVGPGEMPSFIHAQLPPSPEAYLQRIAGVLPPDVTVSGARVVVDPSASLAILREAELLGVDLVAMATHGTGGARSLLLGSTAAQVLRGIRKPLLLFRPPPLARGRPHYRHAYATV